MVRKVQQRGVVVGGEVVRMVAHKKFANYNEATSVFIAQLNPRCNEEDIIKEVISLLLHDFSARSGEGLKRESMG
jgi:hypothetical protein